MEVDLDPMYDGIKGQGQAKHNVFFCLVSEKDRGQVKVTKIISQGHPGQGHCQKRRSECHGHQDQGH